MTIEKLNADVAKAAKVAEDWEAKAASARAEADELDRSSGSAILENPSVAEKVTVQIEAKKRTARAYDSAAAEAREKLKGVYRKHVEAEASQLEKDATTLRRDAEKHRAEVEKILVKLEALDGVRYEPRLGHGSSLQNGVYISAEDGPRETRGQDLEDRAEGAATQAKYVRHILATGSTANFPDAPSLGYLELPPVTKAALDAGAL